MSAFTDAMTALVAELKASQVAVDPAHIAAIDASVATLTSKEAADEVSIATNTANVADVQAGLKILTDGLVPAPTPAPTPAPAPETPTPAPAPAAQ